MLCAVGVVILLNGGISLAQVDQDGNSYPPGDPPDGRAPIDPGPAPAGVQVFDNLADFFAAAGAVTTEDFEDEPLVGDPNGGAVSSLTFDDFTAESVPASLKILNVEAFGNHNTTPGGAKYLSADTDVGGTSGDLTYTFTSPLTALGLFLIDIEGAIEITVNGVTYPVPSTASGGEAYFGIVTDASFSTIDIISPGNDSHYSMDDVSYGGDAGGDGGGDVPATTETGLILTVLLVLAMSTVAVIRRGRCRE
jgi:hypothetical protein